MICSKHNKDTIGTCQWCGKVLCPKCVAKKDGRKAYCANCAVNIAPMLVEKQMNVLKQEYEKEKTEATRSTDYFNFSSLKPRG